MWQIKESCHVRKIHVTYEKTYAYEKPMTPACKSHFRAQKKSVVARFDGIYMCILMVYICVS